MSDIKQRPADLSLRPANLRPPATSREWPLANLVPKILGIVYTRGQDLSGPPLGLPGLSVLLEKGVAISVSRLRTDGVMITVWTNRDSHIGKVFSAHVTAEPSAVDHKIYRYCGNTLSVLSWRDRRKHWEAVILAEGSGSSVTNLTIPQLVKRHLSLRADAPKSRGRLGGAGKRSSTDPDVSEARGEFEHLKARWKSALHARFEKHVLKKLRSAERLVGDALGHVRELIEDLGAVEVAKMLVDPSNVRNLSRGFKLLMQNGAAQLTIEQAMIDFAHTSLFTTPEIDAARARLAIFRKRGS